MYTESHLWLTQYERDTDTAIRPSLYIYTYIRTLSRRTCTLIIADASRHTHTLRAQPLSHCRVLQTQLEEQWSCRREIGSMREKWIHIYGRVICIYDSLKTIQLARYSVPSRIISANQIFAINQFVCNNFRCLCLFIIRLYFQRPTRIPPKIMSRVIRLCIVSASWDYYQFNPEECAEKIS